ncbi:MAG: hypothetical protein EOO01_00875 [Chitinophagaceae bacterium]|nr:MAG: hypothetical protein EOO01_00875 [Chitinophagaceae bacterium]
MIIRSRICIMRKTWMLSILFFLCLRSTGQDVEWRGNEKERFVGTNVAYLEDRGDTITIERASDPQMENGFRHSEHSILNFGFTRSVYWLRITIKNNSTERLLLSLEQAFLPKVTLYYQNDHGQWDSLVSGYGVPLYQKKRVDHFQVFPLPRKEGTYYLRLHPLLHAIPVVLIEENHWSVKAASQKFSYGIYAGILLFAIIINVFLFFSLRKTYFLNYSLLVFFYLLTSALVMEGYAVYLFPTIDLMFWYKIVPVLDMPALLFYCIAFFTLRQRHPNLYRLALYSALFCILYLLAVPFLPLLPVLLINQVFALMVFMLGIRIGWVAGKSGNELGYYFAGAYMIWFLLVSVELLYLQTGYPKHVTPLSYVSIAVFVESFLLAFLQAKRFGWERKADHRRQFEMEQQFQRDLLNSKLEIQEQTFTRISQELHDNIGQVLSLAKVQANILEQQDFKDEELLVELKQNIGQALGDLRTLAKGLNKGHVQVSSLLHLLQEQADQLRKVDLSVDFRIKGEERYLDEEKKLILFRIIQEALQNILKHANATQVQIAFNFEPNQLAITIRDNGKGFDRSSVPVGGGLGLSSMGNRASMVGAQLDIQSACGEGTLVRVVVPHGALGDSA